MLQKILSAFSALVLLTIGPSAKAQESPREKYPNIRTIGIISAIGDYLTIAKREFMLDTDTTIPIEAWRLDEIATEELAALLATHFSIKKVAYNRDDFSKQDRRWWGSSETSVRKTIAALRADDGIDAYLLIWKNISPPFGARQVPRLLQRGVGVVMSNPVIGATENVEFARFKIELIDAKTSRTIAEEIARVPAIGLTSITDPHFPMDDTLLPDKAGRFNDDQLDDIRADITKLVRLSLRETIRETRDRPI